MKVRPLTQEDDAAWHGLMLDATRTHPAAFLLSHEEVASLQPDQVAASLGRGHLRGLFDNAALIGFAGLHLWELDRLRHRADVGPFYVAPARRGSGAADLLMGALVETARARGVTWLDLWVAVDNVRAIGFYRRFGFEQVALRHDALRLPTGPVDDLLMTLNLDAARRPI